MLLESSKCFFSYLTEKEIRKHIFSIEFTVWITHLYCFSFSQIEILPALHPVIVINKLGRDGRQLSSELGKTAIQSDLSYA